MPAELRLFVKVFAQKGAEREVRALIVRPGYGYVAGDKAVREWLTLGAHEVKMQFGPALESPLVEAGAQDLDDLAEVMFVAQSSLLDDDGWAPEYKKSVQAALARLNGRFFGGGR